MKGFAKIMLIIASVAIGILFIVVASVAWFTSNPEVDANEVSLSSANTLVVSFDSNLYKSNYSYDGQTGLGEENTPDAPYVYPYGYFKVNLTNSAEGKKSVVKLDFSTITMECAICTVPDLLISDLFRVKIACYQEESGGAYQVESQDTENSDYAVFVDVGAGNGGYKLIADDYTLGANNYLYRSGNRVEFDPGKYYFAFTYIFLPPNGGGYVESSSGTFIGQVAYKQIHGSSISSYDYAAGVYTKNENGDGDYTRMIVDYVSANSVDKYVRDGDNYTQDNEHGTYIKVKDHLGNDLNEYVAFDKFAYVAGFPYADIRYQGATYAFSIVCSVEEV